MYKVFLNDRTVFLDTTINKSLIQDALYFEIKTKEELQEAWNTFLNDSKERNLYLFSSSNEKLKELFFSNFKIIEAAGGLVLNDKKELLCIFRLNKWDLPKGKVEKNETTEEAALREVEEETGIHHLQISDLKTITYHLYQSPYHKKAWILKPTYWYRMQYDQNETLIPQEKEDITIARWCASNELKAIKQQSYASLQSLFEIE